MSSLHEPKTYSCQKIIFFYLANPLIKTVKKLQAMKRVTLQFPDLYLLWSFAQTLHSNSLEINTGFRTLVCSCSQQNISEATTNYKAKVIGIEP